MDILRITARWTGFTGAPGYSNFHFANDAGFWDGGLLGDGAQEAADSARARVRSAFFALQSRFPDGVSVDIESEALILDSDSGEILGFTEVEGNSITWGGDSGGYSAASGAVVNWRTNDYRAGRRIRGRTFLVPLSGASYQSDGTLTSNALGDIRDFAEAMIGDGSGPDFGVWSRPVGGSGGVFASVVNFNVPDMAAVLRSRRD